MVEEGFDFVVESAGDGHAYAFGQVDVFSSEITFLSESSIDLDRRIASNHPFSHTKNLTEN